MGRLQSPLETIWFDAVEVEVVAGTIRYTIYAVERDDEGRTVRRALCRLITDVAVAQQSNAEVANALLRAERPTMALKVARNLQ